MRLPSLAIALCVPTLTLAQPPVAAPPFDAVMGSFFAISVPDLAASTKWYTEKLGLRSILSVPKQPGAVGVNVLQGNGLTVEIQQHDGAEPVTRGAPSDRQGIFKVGVAVKDFDATLAMLRARGVGIFMGPFPKRSDQPAQVIVRDTSGTLIQFFGQ
jgi:catechol 2,3-dioxygenase-like lactoylglutathione lyase family enzyme